MVTTKLLGHSLIGGKTFSVGSITHNKLFGTHGLHLKEWIKKWHCMMLNTFIWKFALIKRLIALIHFMKNGKENGIIAKVLKMRTQTICKTISAAQILIVVQDFAVVLPLLMMKMAGNLECCMSVMMLDQANGWIITIGKLSIPSNACKVELSLVLHLLLLQQPFISAPDQNS